jgi:hypothetical protein
MREGRDLLGRAPAADHGFELRSPLDQCSPFRTDRERAQARRHPSGELRHLRVFGRAYDRAVGDRTAIIDRHIVEQTPSSLNIAGIGHRRSGDQQQHKRRDQRDQR